MQQGIDTQTGLDTPPTREFLVEAIVFRTAFYRTMLSMLAYFQKIPARTSNVQKKCVEQLLEHGQQWTVATDFSEDAERDTDLPSTFTKDNSYSFGDNQTWARDVGTAQEL